MISIPRSDIESMLIRWVVRWPGTSFNFPPKVLASVREQMSAGWLFQASRQLPPAPFNIHAKSSFLWKSYGPLAAADGRSTQNKLRPFPRV